jgi:glycosyltransferase involved in cell wall biosynthesis
MRVAAVFLAMPVGGAEDLAVQAAHALAPRGVETVFVCLREPGVMGEELLAAGAPLHALPVAGRRRFSRRGRRRLEEFLRDQKIDVVHSHTYHAHTYAVPAARAIGCPVLVHHHKTLEKMKWHRWWTMRFLLRRAQGVLALSAATAGDLRRSFGLDQVRVRALPNAVDSSVFHPVPAEQKREQRRELGLPERGHLMVTVASLNEVKNHRLGLQALARVVAGETPGREVFWVIVGEGRERAGLEAERDQLGLRERVFFVGNQRPVSPWLQMADAFLFPSRWEGQSLALLQARACGLPILASAIEGNTALLGTEHPGLFASEDIVSCAEQWARLAAEPEWAHGLVEAQNQLPLPTWDSLVDNLHGIYQSLERGELLP